jgi:hypothetical protein
MSVAHFSGLSNAAAPNAAGARVPRLAIGEGGLSLASEILDFAAPRGLSNAVGAYRRELHSKDAIGG